MGYADAPERTGAGRPSPDDYREKTDLNRRILDHLLHDAFSDDADTEAESDLVLDPDPPPERIVEVLGKYPFRDVKQAYRNLMALGEEKIRFLSDAAAAGTFWPPSPRSCCRPSPPRPIPTRRWSTSTR